MKRKISRTILYLFIGLTAICSVTKAEEVSVSGLDVYKRQVLCSGEGEGSPKDLLFREPDFMGKDICIRGGMP